MRRDKTSLGEYDYNTYSNKNAFDYSFLLYLFRLSYLFLFQLSEIEIVLITGGIPWAMVAGFHISAFRNRNRFNNRGYTMGNGGWFPFIGGGGFGNNDSGSSSGGSDFGGFGGGDFGGGGAGGSW